MSRDNEEIRILLKAFRKLVEAKLRGGVKVAAVKAPGFGESLSFFVSEVSQQL
jgi:chaperonin GroEL (HSP60 family)